MVLMYCLIQYESCDDDALNLLFWFIPQRFSEMFRAKLGLLSRHEYNLKLNNILWNRLD